MATHERTRRTAERRPEGGVQRIRGARREMRVRETAAGRAEARRESRPPQWLSTMGAASALNFLIGIWLIVSPAVIDFHGADAAWNPVVFGVVTAILALVKLGAAHRATAISWVNAAVGAWLFVSGFWLEHTGAARLDVWIFGALIFIFAAISAGASEEGRSGSSTAPTAR